MFVSQEGLLSLKFGRVPFQMKRKGSGIVGFKLGVVVCVDDPTVHQLTSGSNHGIASENPHELQATHTSLGTKMCGCMCRGGGGARRERKRVRERDIEAKKGTKEECACERVRMEGCLMQSIQDIEPAIRQMTCGPKANKKAMCCPAAIYL